MSEETTVVKKETAGECPSYFRKIADGVAFGANVAVISGIIFAFVQIKQSENAERCRVAMTAIEPTRTIPFLDAYRKLRDAYVEDPSMSAYGLYREDLYYVMSVYDNIAILCLRDLADEDLVKSSIVRSIKELLPILDAMKISAESKTNLSKLVTRFEP